MVPLFVMVPETSRLPPVVCNVPALVWLLRDAVPPLFCQIRPVPLVVNVPPVMLTPLCKATVDPFAALIVPAPLWVQVPPCICNVAPLVASIVPVLVLPTLPIGSRFSVPPARLALIVPLLAIPICPWPTPV